MNITPAIEPDHRPETALDDEPQGPRCTHCNAVQPPNETICRKCGYYAPLGRVVPLDPADREGGEPRQAPPTFWQVWSRLVPGWAWASLGCVLFVVAESVAVAQVIPPGRWRTLWSFSQLLLGGFAFLGVHFMAHLTLLMENAGANLLDIIIKPLACWAPVFKQLPRGWWRIAVAGSSLTAVLMSLLVIRGLDYKKLLDWGIKEQPQSNLVGAIVEQAKRLEPKNQTLEEALNDLDEKVEEPAPEPDKLKVKIDCVVIGYTTHKDRPDELTGLIVASAVRGTLKVVAVVSGAMPPETQAQLMRRFAALQRADAFVDYTLPGATWVEPRVTCRIKCLRQRANGSLDEPEFDSLLSELSLP